APPPAPAEHRHRDCGPVHSQPRKVRPPAAIPDTGRLLRCVAPSTPAWMTHAIPRTGPAVPMLTDQPFHAVSAPGLRPGAADLWQRYGRTSQAAGSGGQEDTRAEHPGRVDGGLGGGQGEPERARSLALVPGPVLAADRVVVGDGAAGGQHGLGRGAFTSVPAPQAWAGAPESRA